MCPMMGKLPAAQTSGEQLDGPGPDETISSESSWIVEILTNCMGNLTHEKSFLWDLDPLLEQLGGWGDEKVMAHSVHSHNRVTVDK